MSLRTNFTNIKCKVKLSPYEKKLLKKLFFFVLEPFEKATLKVEVDKKITFLAIPVICGLKRPLT